MINIDKLLKELICELETQHKDNFTGLVLFGSYAKGTQTEKSDVDIILTFKKLPKDQYLKSQLVIDTIIHFESKYFIEINPLVVSKLSEVPLTIEIADYAKVIYDKTKTLKLFFKSILRKFKQGTYKKYYLPNNKHLLQIN